MLSSGSAQENCHSRIYPNVLDVMPTWPSDPLFMTKCVSMPICGVAYARKLFCDYGASGNASCEFLPCSKRPNRCKLQMLDSMYLENVECRGEIAMKYDAQHTNILKCFEKYESRNNTFKVATLDE